MRLQQRNLSTIYYCLYQGKEALTDEQGYETGESKLTYGKATAMRVNVSHASGFAQTEVFGTLDNYDKVVMTDDMNCPIDENTVLFIDKDPEYDADGKPVYDYTVRRVAKSLNVINIAVRKVTVL